MDKVLILENRDDVFKEIEQLIHQVEANLETIRFLTMEEFFKWTQALTKGVDGDRGALGPGEHVLFLVLNDLMLGPQHMGLVEKLSEALKSRGKIKVDTLPVLFVGY